MTANNDGHTVVNLRLPNFPDELMNTTWQISNRVHAKLIGIVTGSIKYLFISMCAVHVFGKDSMTKASLERIVQVKCHKLA